MKSLRRILLVAVAALVPLSIQAADLRTTVCDKPICRTVSLSSDPMPGVPHDNGPQQAAPRVIEKPYLSTEQVFAGDGGCAEGCLHGGCAHGGCDSCCQLCCIPWRGLNVELDFLLGWRHGMRFPSLMTTSPNGTAQVVAGVLPNATTIFPTEPIGEDARPGARLTLGTWFDDCQCWGVEGRYFMLADEITTFTTTSTGNPILARPFFDVLANAQASRLVAFPGLTTPGGITIDTESQLLGGDALLKRAICRWGCGEVNFVVGYQFARLDETLTISDLSTDADPANIIVDGTTLELVDRFATRNNYQAATLGGLAKIHRDGWRWEILGKIGLGNMRETVTIAGTSETTAPGGAGVVAQGGLLADGVNIGTFTQNQFCASPEVNVKMVYEVSQCLDVSVGYSFLYFTNVVQPGNQIDPNLLAPAQAFTIRDSEFWMHAFQCGVNLRF